MTFDYSTVAFVDTETIGLDIEYHPVWEVAVIVDEEAHVWQQEVGRRLLEHADPIALAKNGFDQRYGDDPDVSVFGTRESVAKFGELTRGRHIVGAAPWFDAERMHKSWRAVAKLIDGKVSFENRDHPWHHRHYDIGSMAFGHFGRPIGGLKDVAEALQIPYETEKLHTALYDAVIVKQCFERMVSDR